MADAKLRRAGVRPAHFGLLLLLIAAFAVGARYGATRSGRPDGDRANERAGAAAKQLWTCGMHPQVIQDYPGACPICHMDLTPIAADATAREHGLRIDPVVVQNMGLRVSPVARERLVRSVRAVGWLVEPEPRHFDVNLRVGGWVEKLYADVEGMQVDEGDPLFELYSPELTVAIEELIASARVPAGADAGSARLTESVRAASARKLEALGVARADIERYAVLERAPPTVLFRSPIEGHVTEKNVYAGARIEAGTRVLQLADRSSMWLDAQIYERDLDWIREGQFARATVGALPGRNYDGQIVLVHPHLDPATRTALARIELANSDHALRQGMYAAVEIPCTLPEASLVVAREAVIDTGLRRIAFVALGTGRFEPRELALGRAGDGGRVEVLSGLAAGESVVVSGQFLLDAESRVREAIQKYLAHGLVPPAPDAAPAPAAVRAERASTAEAPQPALDGVFRAYLALGAELGAVRERDDPIDAAVLGAALDALVERASGETRGLAQQARTRVDALSAQAIDAQRQRWMVLSDALIALADRSPPSRDVGSELYVVHCPMVPGDWMQADRTIQNPYYARSMKACGEIVRTIPTVVKGPP